MASKIALITFRTVVTLLCKVTIAQWEMKSVPIAKIRQEDKKLLRNWLIAQISVALSGSRLLFAILLSQCQVKHSSHLLSLAFKPCPRSSKGRLQGQSWIKSTLHNFPIPAAVILCNFCLRSLPSLFSGTPLNRQRVASTHMPALSMHGHVIISSITQVATAHSYQSNHEGMAENKSRTSYCVWLWRQKEAFSWGRTKTEKKKAERRTSKRSLSDIKPTKRRCCLSPLFPKTAVLLYTCCMCRRMSLPIFYAIHPVIRQDIFYYKVSSLIYSCLQLI